MTTQKTRKLATPRHHEVGDAMEIGSFDIQPVGEPVPVPGPTSTPTPTKPYPLIFPARPIWPEPGSPVDLPEASRHDFSGMVHDGGAPVPAFTDNNRAAFAAETAVRRLESLGDNEAVDPPQGRKGVNLADTAIARLGELKTIPGYFGTGAVGKGGGDEG